MYKCTHVQVRPRTAVVDGHWWCLPSLQSTFLWYQLWGPCTPPLHAVAMGVSIWAEWRNIENSWIWLILLAILRRPSIIFPALPWFSSFLRSGCSSCPSIWCTTSFPSKKVKKVFPKVSQKHFVAFNQIIQTNMMLLLGCHGGGNEYVTWEGKRDFPGAKQK